MINPLYLIALVNWSLYLVPTSTIACSCVYSHPQEHFCSSDFVMTLSIQGDPKQLTSHPNDQAGYLRYPVKVNRVFKSNHKTSVRKGFIYTGSPLSSCSPQLQKNITYLMTGRFINGKPFVSLCNFIQEWAHLTVRQKKGFRRNFALACGCKVIDVNSYPFYGSQDENENPERGDGFNFETNRRRAGNCHWETKWELEFDCQGEHSICTPVSTIPDRGLTSGPSTLETPDSNDVSTLYNPGNPFTNQFSINRQRNRSKLNQKCQWDPNPDYLDCLKRKMDRSKASQVEREGEP